MISSVIKVSSSHIRTPISAKAKLALGVLSVLIFLSGYSWLSWHQHQVNPKDTTIPSLLEIGHTAIELLAGFMSGESRFPGWLWMDCKATITRLFLGLIFGVAFSYIVGVGMGCFQWLEAFCFPILAFLTRVPATAMLAVFFVMVGTGEEMFVAMIAFGVMPTLTLAIYNAAKYDVAEESVYKAYTLGASTPEVIWNVVTQQILPRIIESVRLQVGPALVYLIAAEFLMSDVGFGYRLRIQSRLLHMSIVYNYLIALGLIGFGMDMALIQLRKRLSPWFARTE